MHLKKTVAGILLAGGSGTRFGGSLNKVYKGLNGKPILFYSLEALDSHPEIDEIIIVVKSGEEYLLGEPKLKKPFKIVNGGATRRESVYNGINSTNADYVIIQDGARPFLKSYYITDLLYAIEDYPAATIGYRTKDTVKLAYENQLVMRTTNRMNTWLVQTPQCFNRAALLEAHDSYKGPEPTDDCMIMEAAKKSVLLVSGDENNIKITTKNDLHYAEHIVAEKENL